MAAAETSDPKAYTVEMRVAEIRARFEKAKSRGYGDVRSNAVSDLKFLLNIVDPGPVGKPKVDVVHDPPKKDEGEGVVAKAMAKIKGKVVRDVKP